MVEGTCEWCAAPFSSRFPHARFCSERCRKQGEVKRRRSRIGNPPYGEARRAADQRRRARKRGATVGPPFTRDDLARRDGWTCHLCEEPIDPTTPWPEPLSASVDHVVPLAVGGDHSLANARLAHLVCNTRKGPRAGLPDSVTTSASHHAR